MKSSIQKIIAVFILGLFTAAGGVHCSTETEIIDPTFKDYISAIGQLNLVNSLSGVCGAGNTSLDLQASTPALTLSTTSQSVGYAADTTGNYLATLQFGSVVADNSVVISGSNFSSSGHYPVLTTDTTCPIEVSTTSTSGATTTITTTTATLTFTAAGNYAILMYCTSATCGSAPTDVTALRQ